MPKGGKSEQQNNLQNNITMFRNKEMRGYIGAATVFAMVMGLLLFLAFKEIPETNNDIFKVIVGMLVGSLSVVIYTFIGKNPEEVESLKAKNEALEDKVAGMVVEKDKLEKLLRDTQTEVIDKLAVSGKNFKFEVKK
jgi:ABC-type enterochelin transport system permease subunit